MGAVHELREEYRYFKGTHPRYRWLFLVVDFASLLIKLSLFFGFVALCWYILNRGPAPLTTGQNASEQTTDEASQKLTDERIALLREIASPDSALAGENLSATTVEPPGGPVQVASISADSTTVLVETDEIPTVYIDPSIEYGGDLSGADISAGDLNASFAENIFQPEGTESGKWILSQNAEDYTIQLALTVNVEFLVEFARKLPTEYVAAIYPERLNSNGDIQYSLSLGSFPSNRSAEAVLTGLPNELKRYGAHTRTFQEVQTNTSGFLR